MPLDSVHPIDSTLITDSVSPQKDVDGLHTINQGKVAVGDIVSGFLPCTPNGCLELIKRFLIEIWLIHVIDVLIYILYIKSIICYAQYL